MYLKTPRRYTPKGMRRRIFNLKWWWLYLLTPVVIFIGAGVWQNRDMIRQPIERWMATQAANAANSLATIQAPTPTATDSPVNYLIVANAAYQRGAMDEAIRNYALAAEGMPNDPAVYFRLTHLLITSERGDEALAWAEKAINADPFSPLGWAIRGMALEWDGQYARAIASLLRALDLDPNNATALSFLAEAYTDLGLPARAEESIARALVINPTDFNVQRNHGYVLFWSGDFDGARDAFERALQLEPTQAYIAEALADVYFRQGDNEAGIELLRQIVERNPHNSRAQAALAKALFRNLGEVEQARAVVERCVALMPDSVPCLSYLGALQVYAGEYNLCARTYERAAQSGSRDPYDYYYAGYCYTSIGDCARAVPYLREGMGMTDDPETLIDFRDALASCQVIVTLVPTATPESAATPTPEAGR